MKRYRVIVKPGSSQEKIIESASEGEEYSGELTVFLRAKPHDGEANTALIRLLAKHFDVPKTTIKVVRGQKSRTKIIEF